MTNKNKINTIKRRELHKERVSTGTHNYFFDVKEANNGSKYIVIDQRKKVGTKYESVKMRIFADELLEFERILRKVINIALEEEKSIDRETKLKESKEEDKEVHDLELHPLFFEKLLTTSKWEEFEQYTYYLLKLLGIQKAYKFLGEHQAGKADGFFKFGNLAVIYDCTLDNIDVEEKKREQIINYCNRLSQGSIELLGKMIEEFHNHHKQVWIITRGISRRIKFINDIHVKEVSIKDIMNLYEERLTNVVSDEHLEDKLKNI